MTKTFQISALSLSPVMKEANNNHLIRRVNYMGNDNLVIETPLVEIKDLQLIVENTGKSHKILLRSKLLSENSEFMQLVQEIDEKIREESDFGNNEEQFLPSFDYKKYLNVFIPIYKKTN